MNLNRTTCLGFYFDRKNYCDATLVGILTMISAYFILKGMYDEK
ncbi:hypothetical protein JEHA107958_10360 [Jeotgalicoccus halotolerans]|uniref:Uncharacterized protein n=1 Tax=Jeotgalicoccus halotolerans TaxID=157227 RepID=A0A3E0B339_9STAP|nr:hypothetical protein DFR63_0025 [Jeotgalicoccus halotolerans]